MATTIAPRLRLRPLWSELPEELLSLIFERILDLSDLHQCLKVCPSWHLATCDILLRKRTSAPLLLLLHPQHQQEVCKFINLDDTNAAFTSTPRLEASRYIMSTSNKGWLLIMSKQKYYTTLKFSLYNPLTGQILQLPPPPKFATFNQFPRHIDEGPRLLKVIISTNIMDPNCIIYIFVPSSGRGAIYKPTSGSNSFQQILRCSTEYKSFADMIFHKGELFVVTYVGQLLVVKVEEREDKLIIAQEHKIVTNINRATVQGDFYLVEEPVTQELILVAKQFTNNFDVGPCKYRRWLYKTTWFRFFKLTRSTQVKAYWKEVAKFESANHALLLALGDSKFVDTPEVNQTCYKPNCIYFFDEFYDANPFSYLKVYDIKTRAIEPFISRASRYQMGSDGFCRWFWTSADMLLPNSIGPK